MTLRTKEAHCYPVSFEIRPCGAKADSIELSPYRLSDFTGRGDACRICHRHRVECLIGNLVNYLV